MAVASAIVTDMVHPGVLSDGVIELRKTCKVHAGQTVTIDDVEIHVLADPEA